MVFRQNGAFCDTTENYSLKNITLTHQMQNFPSYRNQLRANHLLGFYVTTT